MFLFPLDIHTKWVYNNIVRQGQHPLRKEGGNARGNDRKPNIKTYRMAKSKGLDR